MPAPRVKPETKTETPKNAKPEPKSPVTRKKFREAAKPIPAKLGDMPLAVMPKEFETGTLGFYTTGSTVVEIDGVPMKATFMVQVFISNSKVATEE